TGKLRAAGRSIQKKKRPPKRPQHMLSISPVLMRPSIDVPRTIYVGLTNAALDSPTPGAASSATVVAVIARVVPVVVGVRVITVAVVALRLNGSSRSNCCRPDKAQRNNGFC